MTKVSKRIQKLLTLNTKKNYSINEALELAKNFQSTKFIESIETHIALAINPKYNNQQLRANIILPHGIDKKVKIGVFTEKENVLNALSLGADIAGEDDLLTEITSGTFSFDILITTPNLISKLAKVGKILGPKSLMPSQKAGTITTNLEQTITEIKKGKIEYRSDKLGVVHLNIGKTNFSLGQLLENIKCIYESIVKNKPVGIKGKYIKSFTICTTMSPSLSVDISTLKNL